LSTLPLHSSLQTTSDEMGSSFKTIPFKKAKITTLGTILAV